MLRETGTRCGQSAQSRWGRCSRRRSSPDAGDRGLCLSTTGSQQHSRSCSRRSAMTARVPASSTAAARGLSDPDLCDELIRARLAMILPRASVGLRVGAAPAPRGVCVTDVDDAPELLAPLGVVGVGAAKEWDLESAGGGPPDGLTLEASLVQQSAAFTNRPIAYCRYVGYGAGVSSCCRAGCGAGRVGRLMVGVGGNERQGGVRWCSI